MESGEKGGERGWEGRIGEDIGEDIFFLTILTVRYALRSLVSISLSSTSRHTPSHLVSQKERSQTRQNNYMTHIDRTLTAGVTQAICEVILEQLHEITGDSRTKVLSHDVSED